MAKIYRFGRGCQLALNIDRVNAVDVTKVDDKWCVRFFFSGTESGYNLSTEDKETADVLFEAITKEMER